MKTSKNLMHSSDHIKGYKARKVGGAPGTLLWGKHWCIHTSQLDICEGSFVPYPNELYR